MNTQKINAPPKKFAAQANNKGSARAKTKKAWHLVSETGQSQLKRVWVLLGVCVLLLCIISTQIHACWKFQMQRDGVKSASVATQKCHQGHSAQQTTAKVGALGTCDTLQPMAHANKMNISQNQCKRIFVQQKVFGSATIYCGTKGQKSSEVGGKNSNGEYIVEL